MTPPKTTRFIALSMRLKKVTSGYHADGKPIETNVVSPVFFRNVVNIDRIIRSDDEYIFIQALSGSVEAWEYEGHLSDIQNALREAGAF